MGFDNLREELIARAGKSEDMELIKRVSKKKKILLFGAGNCGHIVHEFLKQNAIVPYAFCDNHIGGMTDEKTGVQIISVGDICEHFEDYFILISVADYPVYHIILQQLLDAGMKEENCMCMCEYIERMPIQYFVEHEKEYRIVYDLLEDEYSKKVYEARLKWTFLGEDLSMVMQPEKEQYFDELVHLTDHEVFVDCGAYTGDTSQEFIRRVDGRYQKIYLFEADVSKEEIITNHLKDENYELYLYGVFDENRTLYFDSKGTMSSSSKVSEVDGVGDKIEVVALDNIEFHEKPTFIKMDIEGSEKKALLGSKHIISIYKPKLAICVYHKPEDLYELPLLMKQLNPEYKLFLRHYSNHFTETVCYATM